MTTKVRYISSSPEQVRWGGNDNPDDYLSKGEVYIVTRKEVHSFHTKLRLKGFEDKSFNSVSFKELIEDKSNG